MADASLPHEARSLVHCSDYCLELSPGGQTVYYVNNMHGEEGIYAVSCKGGTPRLLTNSLLAVEKSIVNYHGFDLSPDGLTLAYSTTHGDNEVLYTVPVGGGEPQLLVKIKDVKLIRSVVPQWSPDSSQLAYVDGNDLYVTATGGGPPRKIAHVGYWWIPGSIRWSPDGIFIAALGIIKRPTNAVFVVPASGGKMRQLTSDDDYKEGLEWHPDSRRMTYCVLRYDSETHQAYLDGREPTLLVNAPDIWDYTGTWAPDGQRFFFIGFDDAFTKSTNMYVYDEASGETTLVLDSVEHINVPNFSRNGNTMAWLASRKTSTQTWIMEDFLLESTAVK